MTAPQFVASPGPVLDAAAFAEAAGLDGLFFFDHLLPLGGPDRPVLELAAVLGLAAASTRRLRVGSLVARAPLRGAEVTAAVARTADAISPGRVVFGVGSGDRHSRPEADRYGQHFGSLAERVGAVAGTVGRLAGSRVERWVGGTHPRILEVALEADGWNGWELPIDVFADKVGVLRARRPDLVMSWGGAVLLGRDRDDIDGMLAKRGGRGADIAATPDDIAERLTSYALAGADHLVVSILPNRRDRWELFAEEVLPRLA